MYVVLRVCAYLRKVTLVWIYIESRPAISPPFHKVQAYWQWSSSVSTLHLYRPGFMFKRGVCWLDNLWLLDTQSAAVTY